MNQTTAFNVASQSIDRLWAIARPQTYNAANLGGLAGAGLGAANESARVTTAPGHGIVTRAWCGHLRWM